jgi:hypothetical protein
MRACGGGARALSAGVSELSVSTRRVVRYEFSSNYIGGNWKLGEG